MIQLCSRCRKSRRSPRKYIQVKLRLLEVKIGSSTLGVLGCLGLSLSFKFFRVVAHICVHIRSLVQVRCFSGLGYVPGGIRVRFVLKLL